MKRCRQLSSRKPPLVDVERQFLQRLLDEYREFWGGEILGPNPLWIYLLVLHFRLQERAHLAAGVQERS